MATSKTDENAEKAYAAAAEAKPAVTAEKSAAPKVEANAAPVKEAAKKKAPAKKPAAKKKVLAKKATPAKPVAKKAAKKTAVRKPEKKAATGNTEVKKLKEKIMATNNVDYTTAFTDTLSGAVNEMQTRAQAAYDKSSEAMTEATEFAKGNVEAVVESGKVWAEGVQGLGQSFADEAKSAYETATADLKEMAAVKSPTELFQLQGKILRRNFDAMVAATSKSTDASMKLANDVMAPISGRVNIAAEKLSKVG